ncbi:Nucleotide-diphospho-sugar transferase domain-containing protein [Caenorhabditis elegans]|uniref:Nucleotide-diphospho-sugar transferase domain-containing protein n=1 Tax=Caenorhabditis elegans TaxID=6239 RepID=M1ZJV0_CAEEL|nr:Nucleotide-diphospho-sugar transferase domain-containing protein [Caenorhabditis elegans]CCU83346.1 Nucleotide-diphospho-sugar transferase domain-containing protein [Caenorhabditis elegans]|eukprot:NP_001293530.1 Uncharacterized protein CELE_Y51H7C.12 [Caenorhabditis elegans]
MLCRNINIQYFYIFIVYTLFCYFFGIRFLEVFQDAQIHRRKDFLYNLNGISNKLTFEAVNNNTEFDEFANSLRKMPKAPYLILYDSTNVDVVLNHVCNLQFIPNSLSRLVAISFDPNSHSVLKQKHPNIPNLLFDLTGHKKSISSLPDPRGYLSYSLVLLVHAQICASLAFRGIDFWSMHQDTLWTGSFDQLELESRYGNYNLILDTIGNETPYYFRNKDLACGATFFVRGGPVSYQFFQQVISFMLTFQSPDSTIMSYLCSHQGYKCKFLPHSISSSFNYFESPREMVPVLIQIDGGRKDGDSKMDVLKRQNLVFTFENGTCNEKAVRELRETIKTSFQSLIRQDWSLEENWFGSGVFFLRHLFNVDPGRRKVYLKAHYHII